MSSFKYEGSALSSFLDVTVFVVHTRIFLRMKGSVIITVWDNRYKSELSVKQLIKDIVGLYLITKQITLAFPWLFTGPNWERGRPASQKEKSAHGCYLVCCYSDWTEIPCRHYLSSEWVQMALKIRVFKSWVRYWFIFMMVYKLEMITLQGMVYFEGKRVIIVKEKCHPYMASFSTA